MSLAHNHRQAMAPRARSPQEIDEEFNSIVLGFAAQGDAERAFCAL